MKINQIKTEQLKAIKSKLEAGNHGESKYYRHVCEELNRRS